MFCKTRWAASKVLVSKEIVVLCGYRNGTRP